MGMSKLHGKTKKQLETLKAKTSKEVEDFAMSAIRGKETNLRKIRKLKKEYARILTVLNEKGKK